MHRRLSLVVSAFILLLASACAGVTRASNPLTPHQDWRLAPVMVAASQDCQALGTLADKTPAAWNVSFPGDPWLAVQVPEGTAGPAMLTFSYPDQPVNVAVEAAYSHDSTDGVDGTWKTEEPRQLGKRLDKITLSPTDGRWMRLRLLRLDKSLKPVDFQVTNIALHSIDPQGGNDYWVAIGASIQAQSLRQDVFHDMVAERYPGFDPVLFNEAVSGWTTTNLLNKLPEIMARHPHASFYTIHIGGNNVSGSRPYPGGAEKLETELEQILQMITAAGKTPILSRLSYRAYKASDTKPAVPPEENGSGPYVTAIFDPLISMYCPLFFDPATGRGTVDAYTWFKENQQELSTDGIHVNAQGARSWNRLWADHAGAVIYGK